MTTVANQKAANATLFHRSMRSVIPALRAMSPGQRAASLALLASAAEIPVAIQLLGVSGDERDCASMLDGVLARSPHHPYTWLLDGGLGEFTCQALPRGEDSP